jgi:hypothetical protein
MAFKAILGTLLLSCTMLPGSDLAAAGPPNPLDGLVEVGRGEMRWFGMELYDARLLSRSGQIEPVTTGPVALEITYRRSIPRERLVRTTEREWRRLRGELDLDTATAQGWLGKLGTIWPDVAPGDRIAARVESGGPTRFYGNDELLGIVDDPGFGPAFLGIWLHPETRASELRAGLLGARR